MRAALRPLSCCLALTIGLVGACVNPDSSKPTTGSTPGKTPTNASTGKAAEDGPGPAEDGGNEAGAAADTGAPPAADLIREAPGVDLSKLPEPKRELFWQTINTEGSACGAAHSLAVSLRDDDACRDSMHVAQFIADRLVAGAQPGDIKLQLDALVAALQPREVPSEGRPVYGNERAPVTLVVFADFQCPMCKAEAPELREAIDDGKGRAKLVFKHFPLTQHHDRAEAAAIAAEAAHLQGKFWEMHDKLFGHQDALTDADLETYAKEIGLDVAKWKADMASEAVKLAVAKDRADGETLDIGGTPTVYVNGREFVPLLFDGDLAAWIDDALMR